MKNQLRLLLAATALLALPVTLSAAEAGACCATTKAATASGECCAASGNYVLLKVRSRDAAGLGTALSKLDGVSAVDTCSESKFTKVAYNKDKTCADAVMAAIKDAGFKVEARRVSYAVEGIACGACAEKATKALTKVKGVANAHVCPESKVATVDFNPNRVKTGQLVAALDAVGFKATESVN